MYTSLSFKKSVLDRASYVLRTTPEELLQGKIGSVECFTATLGASEFANSTAEAALFSASMLESLTDSRKDIDKPLIEIFISPSPEEIARIGWRFLYRQYLRRELEAYSTDETGISDFETLQQRCRAAGYSPSRADAIRAGVEPMKRALQAIYQIVVTELRLLPYPRLSVIHMNGHRGARATDPDTRDVELPHLHGLVMRLLTLGGRPVSIPFSKHNAFQLGLQAATELDLSAPSVDPVTDDRKELLALEANALRNIGGLYDFMLTHFARGWAVYYKRSGLVLRDISEITNATTTATYARSDWRIDKLKRRWTVTSKTVQAIRQGLEQLRARHHAALEDETTSYARHITVAAQVRRDFIAAELSKTVMTAADRRAVYQRAPEAQSFLQWLCTAARSSPSASELLASLPQAVSSEVPEVDNLRKRLGACQWTGGWQETRNQLKAHDLDLWVRRGTAFISLYGQASVPAQWVSPDLDATAIRHRAIVKVWEAPGYQRLQMMKDAIWMSMTGGNTTPENAESVRTAARAANLGIQTASIDGKPAEIIIDTDGLWADIQSLVGKRRGRMVHRSSFPDLSDLEEAQLDEDKDRDEVKRLEGLVTYQNMLIEHDRIRRADAPRLADSRLHALWARSRGRGRGPGA
ncbi:hypothetical protein [Caenispirillum salinarum]|uniref:hypothetical protein n=1 Tax=Caenispirillum salinarum TaxID=859058 RepID=UPI0038500BDE